MNTDIAQKPIRGELFESVQVFADRQIWFCVSESSRYVRFMYETVLHKPEVLDGLTPEVSAGQVCYNCGALRSEEEDEERDDEILDRDFDMSQQGDC